MDFVYGSVVTINKADRKVMEETLQTINNILSDYILIVILLVAAVWFTIATRGVQFTMFPEMCRLLVKSGLKDSDVPAGEIRRGKEAVSSFQAFMVSIASRVGTGNLAGVATAIALGGPGAIFWMWVIALLGAATAFVESTLAQLYKIRGKDSSFVGGPAYYILRGLGKKWWAITFAVLITLTFGLAYNTVQANTIAMAFENTFSVSPLWTAIGLTLLTAIIICGGLKSVANVSSVIVPVMAIGYIALAIVIIVVNIDRLPDVFRLIFANAFNIHSAVGGGLGMSIIMGIKRGLFSNEAGEGSAPNVAATAVVSHPVKQGLIQALGVFTDTILICSCTAFIILISGIYGSPGQADGIVLTQQAIDLGLGHAGPGAIFVSIAIFFFAFTSIVANYYYGETNLNFIRRSRLLIYFYRVIVALMVWIGSLSSLQLVWGLSDLTMALMTFCNVAAIALLGKYAVRCLNDYRRQLREGRDPIYRSSTIPEISSITTAWDD